MSSFIERLRAAHKRAHLHGRGHPASETIATPHPNTPHVHTGSGGGAVVGTNARGGSDAARHAIPPRPKPAHHAFAITGNVAHGAGGAPAVRVAAKPAVSK